MRCEEVRRWISPYLDSEVDPHTNFEIAQHLEVCAGCQQVFEAERQLETALASSLPTDPETQAAWEQAVHHAIPIGVWKPRQWQVAVAAVSLALVVLGGWQGWVIANQDLVRSAVSNHRAYVANRLTLDVPSNTPEAVEAFFAGKLPFSVQCPRDLSQQEIQLVGARLCHLKRVPVAHLLYHVGNQPVSLFLVDEEGLARFRQQASLLGTPGSPRAYRIGSATVVTSQSSDGVICAVGEVPQSMLEQLVLAYARQVT